MAENKLFVQFLTKDNKSIYNPNPDKELISNGNINIPIKNYYIDLEARWKESLINFKQSFLILEFDSISGYIIEMIQYLKQDKLDRIVISSTVTLNGKKDFVVKRIISNIVVKLVTFEINQNNITVVLVQFSDLNVEMQIIENDGTKQGNLTGSFSTKIN